MQEKIILQPPKLFSLSNHIPVYCVNAGDQDLLKIEFIFKAGTWQEEHALQAALTNSMLMEGTSSRNATQIAEDVDFFGAYLQHEYEQDSAGVRLITLCRFLEKTIPVAEDVIKNSVFPENELGNLCARKKQHFLVNQKKVGHVARTHFPAMAFGTNHPYGRFVKESDFDTLSVSSLIHFFNVHYHANNCVIIASGKLPPDLIPLLDKHFGGNDWSREKQTSKPFPSVILEKGKKEFYQMEDVMQSAVVVGGPLFNKTHPDFHGIQFVNTLLGGYFSSRLMANIREDKGYTYGIHSGIHSFLHGGIFSIFCETGVEHTNAVLQEIYKELKILREVPVGSDELRRVKNFLMGTLMRSADGPFALAEKFRNIMEYDLDYTYYDKQAEVFMKITADEIMQIAKQYFNPEEMLELVAGGK